MNNSIEWTAQLETGIAEIDVQHQELVRIINLLVDRVGDNSRETIVEILDQLKSYASYHFMTEEQIMQERGYADYASHVDEHAAFVDQLQLFDLDVILASEGLIGDMLHFLRQWLVGHIMTIDMKFAASLQP